MSSVWSTWKHVLFSELGLVKNKFIFGQKIKKYCHVKFLMQEDFFKISSFLPKLQFFQISEIFSCWVD